MANILITGMTSPQASSTANERSLSFSGLAKRALLYAGHNVAQIDPEISWTLNDFAKCDAVLLGMAPITSLAANRSYGALHLIDLLYDDPRLRLFVDAPNPEQITQSLHAIHSTPDNLTKPFYGRRKGFEAAFADDAQERLLRAVERLLREAWPQSLYPHMPWQITGNPLSALPEGAHTFSGLNLDALAMLADPNGSQDGKGYHFVSDYPTSRWTDSVARVISSPIRNMKRTRASSDAEVYREITNSLGAILAPQKRGTTWWTPRYAQALNAGVPIITEWRESREIGDSWSILASQVEDMIPDDRVDLGHAQRADYMSAIPSEQAATEQLEKFLGIMKESQ